MSGNKRLVTSRSVAPLEWCTCMSISAMMCYIDIGKACYMDIGKACNMVTRDKIYNNPAGHHEVCSIYTRISFICTCVIVCVYNGRLRGGDQGKIVK